MADLQKLVASTRSIKSRSSDSLGWPLAAIKAVEASGVRHKPDVERLKGQIVAELRKSGDIKYQPRPFTSRWKSARGR